MTHISKDVHTYAYMFCTMLTTSISNKKITTNSAVQCICDTFERYGVLNSIKERSQTNNTSFVIQSKVIARQKQFLIFIRRHHCKKVMWGWALVPMSLPRLTAMVSLHRAHVTKELSSLCTQIHDTLINLLSATCSNIVYTSRSQKWDSSTHRIQQNYLWRGNLL